MDPEAFGILVACAFFVAGVAIGLYCATNRYEPVQKGRPVSERRMRRLWVIDPLLERGPLLEHQHPTLVDPQWDRGRGKP